MLHLSSSHATARNAYTDSMLWSLQAPCSLSDSQAFDGLSNNFGVVLSSRWHGVYGLIAMLVVWHCVHAAFLYMRARLWY